MQTQQSLGDLTPLQARVAREIVSYARRENLKAGERLAENHLAEQIGTSRSPVNVALRHLESQGVLTHDKNRGYFLNKDAYMLYEVADQFSAQPDDPLYLKLAEDRLANRLPDEVSEADLMRLYKVSRSSLRKILARIQQEGWIEKSVGQGWCFQPMIDSPAAYEESYVFRAALEPTGIINSNFRVCNSELTTLKRQQRSIVDGGYATMTGIELFEANSEFHETLAKWSGNRFIFQSVRRTNQLRRLVEYQQAHNREARRKQCQEHLAILDAIEANDMLGAAALLRTHIEGARKNKVHGNNIFEKSQ